MSRNELTLMLVGIIALFAVVVVATAFATPPDAHAGATIAERCPPPRGDATDDERRVYGVCVQRYRSSVPAAYMTPSGMQMRVTDHP